MSDGPRSVRSQCPYCGVGCGLELLPPAVKGQAVKRAAEGNPMRTARGAREPAGPDRRHGPTADASAVAAGSVGMGGAIHH